MERKKAVEVLRLEEPFDEDDLRDAYEESFFNIRDYFLKNTVIPQLFISRLQRLRKFERAFCTLEERRFEWPEIEVPIVPTTETAASVLELKFKSLSELLKAYERQQTLARTFLAQAQDIPQVVKQTLNLVEVQQAYHRLFYELAGDFVPEENDKPRDEVPASRQVDSGLLLNLLRKKDESDQAKAEFEEALINELVRVEKLIRLLD